MANDPAIIATVKITVKDINGNNTTKQFSSVSNLNFDFKSGKVNIVDSSGSFFFTLKTISSLTYSVNSKTLYTPTSITMS
jgi:hypothetical protein